jgi:hypothetical protein
VWTSKKKKHDSVLPLGNIKALLTKCMRPYATSVCGLKLLVREALNF